MTVMRRVKLNPTASQKALLTKHANGARFTYNATVAKVNGGAKVNKMSLRNEVVTKKDNAFFHDKASESDPAAGGVRGVQKLQGVLFQSEGEKHQAFQHAV